MLSSSTPNTQLIENKYKQNLLMEKSDKVGRYFSVALTSISDKSGSLERPGGSKSVTQGSTELAKLLLSRPPYNRFFVQHDRQNLEALLRERSIAKRYNDNQSKVTDSDLLNELIKPALKDEIVIPDLLPVKYLISGAIVGFDKSKAQGGEGFGVNIISANKKYSIDEVTVTLFMTEVNTGQVIASAANTQSVASFSSGVTFYGFHLREILLEIEAGKSENTAVTLATTVALDNCLAELSYKLLEDTK